MSLVNITLCQLCDVTFENVEDFTLHSCADIKVENAELQGEKPIETNGKLVETFDNLEDFKHDIDPPDVSESDAEYSPRKKKNKKSNVKKKDKLWKLYNCSLCNKNFNYQYKLKKHLKIHIKAGEMIEPDQVFEPKIEIEAQDIKIKDHYNIEYSDINLSEEFLSAILKQVDELCDSIKNGDPNLERTITVNQNLNDAVSYYRNKLFLFDSKLDETKNNIDDYYEELPIYSETEYVEKDSDTDYEPLIKKKRKKSSKSTPSSIFSCSISNI